MKPPETILLVVIRDDKSPEDMTAETLVDVMAFTRAIDAVIYVEPHHMDEETSLIVDRAGWFTKIPFATDATLPEPVRLMQNKALAAILWARV